MRNFPVFSSLKRQRQRSPFIPRMFSLSKEAINFGLLESFAIAIYCSFIGQTNGQKYFQNTQDNSFLMPAYKKPFAEISDQEGIDRIH